MASKRRDHALHLVALARAVDQQGRLGEATELYASAIASYETNFVSRAGTTLSLLYIFKWGSHSHFGSSLSPGTAYRLTDIISRDKAAANPDAVREASATIALLCV